MYTHSCFLSSPKTYYNSTCLWSSFCVLDAIVFHSPCQQRMRSRPVYNNSLMHVIDVQPKKSHDRFDVHASESTAIASLWCYINGMQATYQHQKQNLSILLVIRRIIIKVELFYYDHNEESYKRGKKQNIVFISIILWVTATSGESVQASTPLC